MEVVSLVIASLSALAAVGAVVYARRSADASDRSAGAAEVSAEAAQRSAEVAERSEARQTERNDVVWTPTVEKGEDSRWVLRNSGLDAALDVTVSASFAGSETTEHREEVPPGETIEFDLSQIRKEKYERNRRTARELQSSGIAYFPSYSIEMSARVVWCTPSGVWRVVVFGPEKIGL